MLSVCLSVIHPLGQRQLILRYCCVRWWIMAIVCVVVVFLLFKGNIRYLCQSEIGIKWQRSIDEWAKRLRELLVNSIY